MMSRLKGIIIFALLLGIYHATAQSVFIQPYFGYGTVRMTEPNDDMRLRFKQLSQINQIVLPAPDPLNGNYAWGVKLIYRMEDDYFLNLNTYYIQERTGIDFQTSAGLYPLSYHFDREIKFFDVSIGIQYFFNYSSWKTVNYYFGFAVGVGVGWSNSDFIYQDENPRVDDIDSKGDFSGNAMTANFNLGVLIRLHPNVFLSGEGGYRFANLRELTGQFKTKTESFSDYTTQSQYDYSGFYVALGTVLRLPFFD
ncbi:MAG: hypothetical protein Kow0042_13940 [Calditrichia bacterium]